MKKLIIVTKLHPSNHLHKSNKAKQIITSNAKKKSNEPAHFFHTFATVKEQICDMVSLFGILYLDTCSTYDNKYTAIYLIFMIFFSL